MKNLHIPIDVSDKLYLKDPDSSDLGRKIVSEGIKMIHQLGFEAFTFKKLGKEIKSPESSIYRYFENKHNLLIYLVSWYWVWVEYHLVFAVINIDSPIEKLKRTIKILSHHSDSNLSAGYVDIELLRGIIITESVKAYHTKDVDKENSKGYFKAYKNVVNRVGNIVTEVNPEYEYPHMLVSTVIEGALQQRYFSEHLPSLTDVKKEKDGISDFYIQMVLKVIA